MYKSIQLFIILILFPGFLSANNSIFQETMKAYKSKQYEQAIDMLLHNVDDLNVLSTVEKLKAGIIFSKNLKLYQDIYVKTKLSQQKYLHTLVNSDSKLKSTYAKLYLAEIYILQNELKNATTLLKEFTSELPSQNNYYQIAEIYLAWIAYLNNNEKKYQSIINSIDKTNIILELASQHINILLTGKSDFDINKINKVKQKIIKQGKFVSSSFANYSLRILLNKNKLKQATNIYKSIDKSLPSYIETLSKTKILRFYDVTLIDTIAEYYYMMSKSLLETVSSDKKYHDIAIFYLSELDLVRLNNSSAKKYLNAVEKLRRLPKSISSLTTIRSTTHGYLLGQSSRAFQAWEDAVNNFKNDPIQSSDAVLMCIYLTAHCPKIVQTAQLSAENGRSKRFEALNTNVGRYFLMKKHNAKALRLLENAMDRSNTNSLLANEPLLLLNYAEALRLNNNFPESLQILFSLGENFSIMRQTQDAVQGEYLFRQRSNGSINVF